MSDPFPEIKSKHSLVAKYVTEPLWAKLSRARTMTSDFSLAKAIACAVEFDNQHCGIYAGDWDSYKVQAKSLLVSLLLLAVLTAFNVWQCLRGLSSMFMTHSKGVC